MAIERQEEREFGIFNVTTDKFHNLNYTTPYDDEEEFEATPTALFTHEECERYIVHKEDKEILTILNVKQPNYLLQFALNVIRKEHHDKLRKRHIAQAPRIEAAYKTASVINNSNNSKDRFVQDLVKWDKLVNSHEVQEQGRVHKVMQEKPKLTDYGLTIESFTPSEKETLKSYHVTE